MVNNSNVISLDLFTNAFEGSGYQRFPSGLIIQWGLVSYLSIKGAEGCVCPFYTAFPNRCLSIVSNDGDTGVHSTATNPISNTHFRCWGKSSIEQFADTGLFYIAIGF